ncbi:MAG: aminotransferase class V-fold PLP-dependent enzyme [Firmicutes bacterium]|nr:aminotransferase class V-fold PLP-dependent enzyme [Bacillota bacterium]
MTYFDNGATTFYKPPEVIGAVTTALTRLSANAGRAGHALSMRCGTLVVRARERAAEFFGCPNPDRVVFCYNCTDALNIAIQGYLTNKGGHIVTTALEHNSVLRPLHELERRRIISLTVLQPDHTGRITATAVASALKATTTLVAVTHISNVTGAINPVSQIGEVTSRYNIPLLVDAAQSAGYIPIDMRENNIDFLAIAPHKGVHAPQGVGVLLIGNRHNITATRYGGTGSSSRSLYQPADYPESLESGTLPLPAVAGFLAGLNYTAKHQASHSAHLANLGHRLDNHLSQLKNIIRYNPPNSLGSIFTLNIGNYYSGEVSDILSEQYNICVRGGLHCAPLAHTYLGTLERGAVRISLGVDNTADDVDYLANALKEISG